MAGRCRLPIRGEASSALRYDDHPTATTAAPAEHAEDPGGQNAVAGREREKQRINVLRALMHVASGGDCEVRGTHRATRAYSPIPQSMPSPPQGPRRRTNTTSLPKFEQCKTSAEPDERQQVWFARTSDGYHGHKLSVAEGGVPRDKGCDHEGQEHGRTRVVGRHLQEPRRTAGNTSHWHVGTRRAVTVVMQVPRGVERVEKGHGDLNLPRL